MQGTHCTADQTPFHLSGSLTKFPTRGVLGAEKVEGRGDGLLSHGGLFLGVVEDGGWTDR